MKFIFILLLARGSLTRTGLSTYNSMKKLNESMCPVRMHMSSIGKE